MVVITTISPRQFVDGYKMPHKKLSKAKEEKFHTLYEKYCNEGKSYKEAYDTAYAEVAG